MRPAIERSLALATLLLMAAAAGAAWQEDVAALAPGGFPPPAQGLSARYVFGWSGIEAAAATVRLDRREGGLWQCEVRGGTTGLARSLWMLDAAYTANIAEDGWRSLTTRLTENYRRYRTDEKTEYFPGGVRSWMENTKPGTGPAKWREFKAPALRDMAAALLLARSQPLRTGDTLALAVFPGEGMYLVRAKVEGREKLRWHDADRNVIRLSLEIDAINKDGTTEPHRKFHRGTVWASDDETRLPLRVEVKVFIGYVFAELQEISAR